MNGIDQYEDYVDGDLYFCCDVNLKRYNCNLLLLKLENKLCVGFTVCQM
jgi:hypothetical protein